MRLQWRSCSPCCSYGHSRKLYVHKKPHLLTSNHVVGPQASPACLDAEAVLAVCSAHNGGAEAERQPPEGLAAAAQLRQGQRTTPAPFHPYPSVRHCLLDAASSFGHSMGGGAQEGGQISRKTSKMQQLVLRCTSLVYKPSSTTMSRPKQWLQLSQKYCRATAAPQISRINHARCWADLG